MEGFQDNAFQITMFQTFVNFLEAAFRRRRVRR